MSKLHFAPDPRGKAANALFEALMACHGKYRSTQIFGWMIESILNKLRVMGKQPPIEQAHPADAHHMVDECVDLYAKLVLSIAPFEDLLGPVYMNLANKFSRDGLGQFFTQWGVSKLMAAMISPVPHRQRQGQLSMWHR